MFRTIRLIVGNLYFLVFLNGFLIASLLYFKIEANYESELFDVIQKSINKKIDKDDNKDSILVKIMQTCSDLLGSRQPVFSGSDEIQGFKADVLHPASIDLMTAKGACGSYSLVLARILQNYHYPVRIAQMKAYGRYGSHNVIEANINTQWIVLDPLFDIYFIKPGNAGLASFDDVKKNWDYYRRQLPNAYDGSYKYEGARYTNWDKIPILLPAFKKVLDIFLGKEKADSICLRVHFLRMYDLFFFATLFLYIPVLILTLRKIARKKLSPRYDVPLTLSNMKSLLIARIENSSMNKSIDR